MVTWKRVLSGILAGLALAAVLESGAASAQSRGNRPLPESFAPLASQVKPAVVQVQSTRGLGSGFLVDADGHIVTNDHVIRGSNRVAVQLADGRVFPARIVGADNLTDLAVLKVDGVRNLPFVRFGNSDLMRDGDWVVAIGNPAGLSGTVTAGIVSTQDRVVAQTGPFDELIQTDAAINSGNSGGPLFNLRGEVIGVNTSGIERRGNRIFEGLNFARPSAIARLVVDQIKRFGEARRGWLGVDLQEVTPELARSVGLRPARGVLVRGVTAGSPAAVAGLRRRDVILTYNGAPLTSVRQFQRLVSETETGSRVTLTVWRRGEGEIVVMAQVGRLVRPASFQPTANEAIVDPFADLIATGGEAVSEMGIDAASLSASEEGVLVTAVASGSAAWGYLVPGDIVLEIGAAKINSPADLGEAVSAALEDGALPILVKRLGEERLIALALEDPKAE